MNLQTYIPPSTLKLSSTFFMECRSSVTPGRSPLFGDETCFKLHRRVKMVIMCCPPRKESESLRIRMRKLTEKVSLNINI